MVLDRIRKFSLNTTFLFRFCDLYGSSNKNSVEIIISKFFEHEPRLKEDSECVISYMAKRMRELSFDSFSNITSKTNVKEEVKSKFAKGSDSPQVSAVRLSNAKQDSVDVTVSPSHYLDKEDRISPSLFCQCGRQISDFNILQCEVCLNVERILKCEGYLSVKSEKGVKIEKFWYVVEKRVIYRYGAKTDKTYKRMRSLAGCFFKEEPTERFEDRTLAYCFTIWFGNSLKTKYLCQSKEEYDHWCEVIKASIGYSNFNSYYEMKVSNNYIIGSFR